MLLPESNPEARPCPPQQADDAYTRHYTHNLSPFAIEKVLTLNLHEVL
jgi:hypothetical protein